MTTQTIQMMPEHPDDNPDMNIGFNDWLDYMAEEFPTIDAMKFYHTKEIVDKVEPEAEAEPEATNYMGEDFVPDYSKTDDYEGDGITSELIPGESMVADSITWLAEKAGVPPEAALAMAGIIKKNPKQVKKGVEGMLTPKMKKDGTPFKTSTSGVQQGKATTNIGHAKANAQSGQHMQRNFGNSNKNQTQVATVKTPKQLPVVKTPKSNKSQLPVVPQFKKFVTPAQMRNRKIASGVAAATIATGIGLYGNRNKEGDFVPEVPDAPTPEVEVEEGNQFGYHKQEGQNFWTVDNDSDYWDTHEMGTGDAWSDAEVKKAPAKELDWSSWFN